MNEAPLISLLLAIISVLTVFTLVQYNQLNPHGSPAHYFARSVEAPTRAALSPNIGPTLVNPHANTSNLTVFLRSES